jgi:hypothetical protein
VAENSFFGFLNFVVGEQLRSGLEDSLTPVVGPPERSVRNILSMVSPPTMVVGSWDLIMF